MKELGCIDVFIHRSRELPPSDHLFLYVWNSLNSAETLKMHFELNLTKGYRTKHDIFVLIKNFRENTFESLYDFIHFYIIQGLDIGSKTEFLNHVVCLLKMSNTRIF